MHEQTMEFSVVKDNKARSLVRHIDRDELLQELVRSYLDV